MRPSRLFVVQPRLRPDSVLYWKLSKALNVANSLKEPLDGFYAEDFDSKKLPSHLVVQNLASGDLRAHADGTFAMLMHQGAPFLARQEKGECLTK